MRVGVAVRHLNLLQWRAVRSCAFHTANSCRLHPAVVLCESNWLSKMKTMLDGAKNGKDAPKPDDKNDSPAPASGSNSESLLSRMTTSVSSSVSSSAHASARAAAAAAETAKAAAAAAASRASDAATAAVSTATTAAKDAVTGASSATADAARRAAEYARKGAAEVVPTLVKAGTSAARDYARQKVRRMILLAFAFSMLVAFAYGAGRSLPHAITGLMRGSGGGKDDSKAKE